jgi:hypothetical protein
MRWTGSVRNVNRSEPERSCTTDFSSAAPQELLTIQGDELADFRYETFDASDPAAY